MIARIARGANQGTPTAHPAHPAVARSSWSSADHGSAEVAGVANAAQPLAERPDQRTVRSNAIKAVRVFVSHAAEMARFPADRSFVQAAIDAIGRAEMAPVDMRWFAARDTRPADYCRARVRSCEAYVAVVGFRYGTTVPGENISYTEMEFQEAGTVGLPRLIFLLDRSGCPSWLGDPDHARVNAFRQRLYNAGLIVRTFTSASELELEVFHALSQLTADRRSTPATAELRVSALGRLKHGIGRLLPHQDGSPLS
jgi:hypothetical protein